MNKVLLVEEHEWSGEASNVIGIFPDDAKGLQDAQKCAILSKKRVYGYRVDFGSPILSRQQIFVS